MCHWRFCVEEIGDGKGILIRFHPILQNEEKLKPIKKNGNMTKD